MILKPILVWTELFMLLQECEPWVSGWAGSSCWQDSWGSGHRVITRKGQERGESGLMVKLQTSWKIMVVRRDNSIDMLHAVLHKVAFSVCVYIFEYQLIWIKRKYKLYFKTYCQRLTVMYSSLCIWPYYIFLSFKRNPQNIKNEKSAHPILFINYPSSNATYFIPLWC